MIDFQEMRRLIPEEKRLRDAAEKQPTLTALQEAHDRTRAALEDQRNELRETLKDCKPGNEKTLLEFRYLQGMTAREIAAALHFSEQYVFRILKRGEHIAGTEERT